MAEGGSGSRSLLAKHIRLDGGLKGLPAARPVAILWELSTMKQVSWLLDYFVSADFV